MKRILILGNCPLPDENTKSRPAAGLRTYQFLKPLLGSGATGNAFSGMRREKFKVFLVTIAMPECYENEPGKKEIRYSDDFSQLQISKDDPNLFEEIQKIHDEFHPDAIVGVNTFPAYVAAGIKSAAPMWADLNGWAMAEAQAEAFKKDSNNYLNHYFQMEKMILDRADKFSAVSKPQQYALTGELATLGRLNKETFNHKFVHHVPNGTEIFPNEEISIEDAKKKSVEIFQNVPADAFVALWVGGYNTWVDEITLFKGLERAMEHAKNLYFVSTGGSIAGLDKGTFGHFKKMIDDSKFKKRFVFLGWVATSDIPYIYARANVGLNVDRKCVETMTGARNRINEMMKFGVPVLTTLGSEISEEVERVSAGLAVESGKYEMLGDALIAMYRDVTDRHGYKLKEFGERGKTFIREECSYEKTLRPLLNWLENPRPAPDRSVNINLNKSHFWRSSWMYLKDHGFKKAWLKLRQKVKKIFSRK